MTRKMARPQRLRDELLRQRHAIVNREREEREAVRAPLAAEQGNVCDEGDLCVRDLQTDIDLALLQIRTETIEQIDQALANLDAGTYGACEECGDDIPANRLEALPFARRCLSCEETREASQAHVTAWDRLDAPSVLIEDSYV
jgi:DnaK suppressor protein